ncbi:dimethylarginine dimethylaminohydrolase family protein [Herbaspirillum sp. YR522]|uniref:dimethylarginine dimethylaminohydrolase family protein n=1 Tax=Herbaspirillum sp. YR522 TaxID=1144342 RepID=UPI00026FA211|nr:arginine deiminase-related protein [Herbaspirillum sp. YR522]EJN09748.1 N-dimethylarginine dimethylaminohydrolase [Herbaspirillum sp. YR522]
MKTQHRDVFLMCAPTHFEVSYVINPWMAGNVAAADPQLAARQWQALRDALGELAEVREMPGVPGVPDMVFTANAALVLGDTAVLSRFRHAERQAEEPHFARWLADQGLRVLRMPDEIAFEGAGDALLDRHGEVLWMGYGHRTDVRAAPMVAGWLDVEVQSLKLADARFYHLDTCFCPLEGGYLMYYPGAFDLASQQVIARRVPAARRIAVELDDALAFACNTVNAGRHVLLNRASTGLRQQLEGRGFTVHELPLSEFMRAGGAAKCLTLKLSEPRRHASGTSGTSDPGAMRLSA